LSEQRVLLCCDKESKNRALYGEYIGIFDLKTHKMTDGDLPKKAQELVEEWLNLYSDKLQKMWDSQKIEKLPPL